MTAVANTPRSYTVAHFERRPGLGHHSLEALFQTVRRALPQHIEVRRSVCRYPSRGLARRLFNMLEAFSRRTDVNHVTGDVYYLTLALPARRTILTIHDCEPLASRRGLRRIVLQLFWYTLPVRRARLVTVVSEATRVDLLQRIGVDGAKVVVVPNCIPAAFRPAPKHFEHDRPRILAVGTAHNKNLPRLCAALEGISCQMDIIGVLSGEQRSTLAKHRIAYSNAVNLSEQEMVERYVTCDLLVFVSTYEGFGMPIVEAQSVERPVVTSNVSSMPEVAGDGACLVNPFDVADIRRGVVRVIEDSTYRAELVERGRVNRLRFTAENVAARYAALYDLVATGG